MSGYRWLSSRIGRLLPASPSGRFKARAYRQTLDGLSKADALKVAHKTEYITASLTPEAVKAAVRA